MNGNDRHPKATQGPQTHGVFQVEEICKDGAEQRTVLAVRPRPHPAFGHLLPAGEKGEEKKDARPNEDTLSIDEDGRQRQRKQR